MIARWMSMIAGFGLIVVLNACGGSAIANEMADEMCIVMERYHENDQASMLAAAHEMMELTTKKEEYKKVTLPQLKRAMMKKCPDGWKKYESLQGK